MILAAIRCPKKTSGFTVCGAPVLVCIGGDRHGFEYESPYCGHGFHHESEIDACMALAHRAHDQKETAR